MFFLVMKALDLRFKTRRFLKVAFLKHIFQPGDLVMQQAEPLKHPWNMPGQNPVRRYRGNL